MSKRPSASSPKNTNRASRARATVLIREAIDMAIDAGYGLGCAPFSIGAPAGGLYTSTGDVLDPLAAVLLGTHSGDDLLVDAGVLLGVNPRWVAEVTSGFWNAEERQLFDGDAWDLGQALRARYVTVDRPLETQRHVSGWRCTSPQDSA